MIWFLYWYLSGVIPLIAICWAINGSVKREDIVNIARYGVLGLIGLVFCFIVVWLADGRAGK